METEINTTSPPAMTLQSSSVNLSDDLQSGRCDAQARSIWPIRPLRVMMIFVVFNGWSVMVRAVRALCSPVIVIQEHLARRNCPATCLQNRLHARIAGRNRRDAMNAEKIGFRLSRKPFILL